MTEHSNCGALWHSEKPELVLKCIARTVLQYPESKSAPPTQAPVVLGTITLREHQCDALARIRAAIASHGGALLADAVGLGKTFVALALAREYEWTHVLAPATLLPMWRSALGATELRNVTLHSLHTLSSRPINVTLGHMRTLVVIDEAHHLRTKKTNRYSNAAQFTTARNVLLLTATPVHNRPRDLRNLLALFLGQRANVLDDATLAQCVIRRHSGNSGMAALPAVHEHPPHKVAENPAVLEGILTLASPLPVADGVAASALVRLGLLRAWCSSDAALTETIRRRQLRGEALLHSLAHGRYPSQRELQSWIVGSDSVQLGFPELLAATTTGNTSELLKTLVTHLDSLQALLQLHTRLARADAERISYLRSLLGAQSQPMVAFSQFASTVRALHRALSDLAGVAALTSHGGHIASGAIARHELIAQFAPRAHGRPPPPLHERVRMLLTTDLLAEGVNLQDAGVVVHLDLPWTHASLEQRVGRLARMGSLHSAVHVHSFAPPAGAEQTLRIVEALQRKAGLHRTFVGRAANDMPFAHLICTEKAAAVQPGASVANSAADDATQLRELMLRWFALAPDSQQCADTASVPVACVSAPQPGWIAVVAAGHARSVVVCSLYSGVTHALTGNDHLSTDVLSTGTSAPRLLRAANSVTHEAQCRTEHLPSRHLESRIVEAQRHIAQWMNTQSLRRLAGPSPRMLAPLQKRALQHLAERMARLTALQRVPLASLAVQAEQSILGSRGAGAELQLDQWLSSSAEHSTASWLALSPASASAPAEEPAAHWQLHALLMFEPPAE